MREKEKQVKEFILDTFNARGRTTYTIYEKNIQNFMTFNEFKKIYTSKKMRSFDKKQFKAETGETLTVKELSQNQHEVLQLIRRKK